ncbi:MAG: hypothetical protein IPK04_16265 [Bdellovibrionales bacterium]|nr:hypothetical protein [Bdellovibrionales bacterium]
MKNKLIKTALDQKPKIQKQTLNQPQKQAKQLGQKLGIILAIILGINIGQSICAQAQMFSQGDSFTSVALRGTVVAHCQPRPGDPGSGGPTMVTYSCRESILEPAEMDYFVGPQGIVAETVELQVTHEDGSKRAKSYPYDSVRFRSSKRVNLWVASLFQKPFLEQGINKFNYILKQADQVVQAGQFDVQVERGAPRTCPYSSITIWDPNECSNQISVCRRYFQQFNDCR